jgi:predicted CxxxxCH...CXXCH cytochrome family protein
MQRRPKLTIPCACLAATWLAGCAGAPTSADASAGPPDAGAASPDAAADVPDASPVTPDAGSPDAGGGCGACHGTAANPAPPPDLSGSGDRSRAGVGAHAPHLAASTWHNEVKCVHCHVVPAADDSAHGKVVRPAQVTLQGLAAAGVTASYATGACSVYCHGAALKLSAPRLSPAWTSASGTTCSTCHGLPPAPPHPAASDCGRCHLDVADAAGKIVSASRHLDGYLTAPKGAHLIHLGGAGATTVYDCAECHDGDRYHGVLKDKQPLATTTVCAVCHPTDTEAKRAVWGTWTPP